MISGRQLVALGHSEDALSRDARTGRLHRLHRDIYAVGHSAVTRHGLCMAAVLAAGEDALLSHRSAAWLWGLSDRWWRPVEVTAPTRRQRRRELHLHSSKALEAEDRASSEGVPVTAVPRTLLDFAAVDPFYLPQALNRAERLGLLDLAAVGALISRSAGFRGVARLRVALEPFRPGVFTRSGLERRFLSLIREAGLPRPLSNFHVDEYELDAYWPAEQFAVELDTYDYHGDRSSFETDRLRQEDLKLGGIEMIRVTGVRLDREPKVVIARLEELLAQRRRQLHPAAAS